MGENISPRAPEDVRSLMKRKIDDLRRRADMLQGLLDELPESLSEESNRTLWAVVARSTFVDR